ncbi:MAG: DUF2927 domain-containing protein [Firmicutes bacterium]|nr:DUF2927 domain-containing protein [Bacillota bacterium]
MNRRKPLRLLSLILCACLLLGAAPIYAAGITEQEAADLVFDHIYHSLYGEDVPPWDRQAVPGFEDSEVIQYFVEVALYGEYEGYRGFLMRYEEPIKYYVMGEPQGTDEEQLAFLAETLNTIDGYPGISRTWDENEADIKVMFSDEATYENYFGLNVPNGSWGYSSVWYYTDPTYLGEISDTYVWISSDAWPRQDRDSIICEEFIQGHGLLNDPTYGYYSIFDQNRNDCDWPSPLDWAVVRLLYDPRMDRKASESKIRSTAQDILNSWK